MHSYSLRAVLLRRGVICGKSGGSFCAQSLCGVNVAIHHGGHSINTSLRPKRSTSFGRRSMEKRTNRGEKGARARQSTDSTKSDQSKFETPLDDQQSEGPTPAPEVVWFPIADIKVGKRFRKDMGDLELMKKSIQEHGQIAPIGVQKSDSSLIYGGRRLQAMKELGHEKILVHLQDYDELDRLLVEYDENYVRKSFTPSEAVEVKRRIEPRLKAAAKERQKQGASRGGKKAGPRGLRAAKVRDLVSEKLGISHVTLARAEEIVAAVEKDPNDRRYLDILREMDKTSNVNQAYAKYKRISEAKNAVPATKFVMTDPGAEWYRWKWTPLTGGDGNQLNEDSLKAPYETKVPKAKVDEEGWSHVLVQDIFADGASRDDISRILDLCDKTTNWTYVFVTEHPAGLSGIEFPDNCWVGVSVATQEEAQEAITELKDVQAKARFLEIDCSKDRFSFDDLTPVDWIVVTAKDPSAQPTWEDVFELESAVYEHDKPVHYKPSIDWRQIAPSEMPEPE